MFTLTTPTVITLDVTYVNGSAKIKLDDKEPVASAVGKISFPVTEAGTHTVEFVDDQTYVKTATILK